MKHTECKDCELSKGDCGYHFKMDGATNYEIASLSACDQYGNCEFFKSKVKPKGDTISRSDIKDHIGELLLVYSGEELANAILNAIDNAPTVEPDNALREFAKFVRGEVLDDYFEENSGAFAEIACRKLVKLGLVKLDGNTYKEADNEGIHNQ